MKNGRKIGRKTILIVHVTIDVVVLQKLLESSLLDVQFDCSISVAHQGQLSVGLEQVSFSFNDKLFHFVAIVVVKDSFVYLRSLSITHLSHF